MRYMFIVKIGKTQTVNKSIAKCFVLWYSVDNDKQVF